MKYFSVLIYFPLIFYSVFSLIYVPKKDEPGDCMAQNETTSLVPHAYITEVADILLLVPLATCN